MSYIHLQGWRKIHMTEISTWWKGIVCSHKWHLLTLASEQGDDSSCTTPALQAAKDFLNEADVIEKAVTWE